MNKVIYILIAERDPQFSQQLQDCINSLILGGYTFQYQLIPAFSSEEIEVAFDTLRIDLAIINVDLLVDYKKDMADVFTKSDHLCNIILITNSTNRSRAFEMTALIGGLKTVQLLGNVEQENYLPDTITSLVKLFLKKESDTNHFKNTVMEENIKPGNTTQPVVDLEELYQLSHGDKSFVRDMIETFIQTTQEAIVVMDTDLKNNNYNGIAEQAHKIVPACRHFGAIHLFDLLKKTEKDIRSGISTGIKELIEKIKHEVNMILPVLEAKLKEGV